MPKLNQDMLREVISALLETSSVDAVLMAMMAYCSKAGADAFYGRDGRDKVKAEVYKAARSALHDCKNRIDGEV